MRSKLIGVFAPAVLIMGALFLALGWTAAADRDTVDVPPRRGAIAAAAQLELETVLLERWLAGQSGDPQVRQVFEGGTPAGRGDAATTLTNRMMAGAQQALPAPGKDLQLVAIVDAAGVVVGRNGSTLMRGEDLEKAHAGLKAAILQGTSGSQVWVNPEKNEQLIASFAPVRAADGAVVGAILAETAVNDGRLNRIAERSAGMTLAAFVKAGERVVALGHTSDATSDQRQQLTQAGAAASAIAGLLASSVDSADVGGLPEGSRGGARILNGVGGSRLALVAIATVPPNPLALALIWIALGSTLIGFVCVVIGAGLFGNYLSQPITKIEEGLLAVINGKQDLRFEIEHAEYGGLVFRLNSLLNQVFQVEEDVDDEGRVSRTPSATPFEGDLSVDETMALSDSVSAKDVRALREEDDAAYYDRVHTAYVQAKREVGDPTDHITKEAFLERLMTSEREMSQKHGKPVRFQVELRGREVVLVAVPLA
jgi:hypothetical protein